MPTIESILGVPNLIGLIQTVKTGIPRVLPDAFFNLTRDVFTDQASYRRQAGTRRLAKAAPYGAPSRGLPKIDLGEIPVKLIHSIHNQMFGQVVLQNLGAFAQTDPLNITRQRLAEAEISRQTAAFKQVFENTRTAAVASAISKGKIWLAADGTFLFSSSGAAVTVDFGIPSSNSGDLDAVLDSTHLTWENTSADIISALIALKTKAVQSTGYPIRYAFYGANIPKYLLSNPAASGLIQRNPAYNTAFLNSGEIPGTFQDLVWVPVYTSFAEDDNGVVTSFFDPDTIVFTPEITREWYELLQGSYAITNMSPGAGGIIGMTAADIVRNMVQPFGMFSYAYGTNDPIGIKQVMGDTFLPTITNPNVVYSVKVKYT